ncbi:MAG TPA: tetratricopeptide repeat protein [candidate division Zixibacteria bacterium]|nr:tetratricopeptide repeat protein [candidate division Zixibacteria bacterium]
MGRKRSRAGQQVYLCLALLTVLSGCALFRPPLEPKPVEPPEPIVLPPEPPRPPGIISRETAEERERREARERLALAQNLLSSGDYEAALRESQRVVELMRDKAPADAAVFNMGLIFAHPKNPKRDNRRAIAYFNRVIKNYPESGLAEQARIWVGVLDGVEKLKQVDLEIEERKRDRSR